MIAVQHFLLFCKHDADTDEILRSNQIKYFSALLLNLASQYLLHLKELINDKKAKAQSFEDNKQKVFVSLYISTKLPITTVYVRFKENY